MSVHCDCGGDHEPWQHREKSAREVAEQAVRGIVIDPNGIYDDPYGGTVLERVSTAYLQALDRLALAEGVVEEAKKHVECGCDCGQLVAGEHQDDPGSGDTAFCASWCFNNRLPALVAAYEEGAKG